MRKIKKTEEKKREEKEEYKNKHEPRADGGFSKCYPSFSFKRNGSHD